MSDEQLVQFAKAFTKVQGLREGFEKKVSGAGTPDEAKRIQAQAQEAIEDAVKQSGMSIEQYSQISQQLGKDDALRQRLERLLQQG